jgi:hypothetical protein
MEPWERNNSISFKKFVIVRILNCSDLMENTEESDFGGKKGIYFPFHQKLN